MTTFYKIDGIPFEDYFIRRDLFSDGGLWIWGRNNYGQLGDNTRVDKSSPIQTVAGGTNWKLVSSGWGHTAAIKTDGTLWTWGHNNNGQLGDNTSFVNKSSPIQTIAGGTNWKTVSCGAEYTTAIKTDGTLWAWGNNDSGQLGDNTITKKSSPVQILIGTNTWKLISCGERITLAIKTDGTLWGWGENQSRQLCDGTTIDKRTPIQILVGSTNWKSVSSGWDHTAAIKTDGTLWTWGASSYGVLGDNTLISKSTPIQIGNETTWKSISSGGYNNAAIKTDGTLWLWGHNGYGGPLGDGTTVNKSSPVQTSIGGTNWKSVTTGCYFYTPTTLALKTDGTLWAWGAAAYGALGDNTTVFKSTPSQIGNGTNWKSISNAGECFSVAIRDDS